MFTIFVQNPKMKLVSLLANQYVLFLFPEATNRRMVGFEVCPHVVVSMSGCHPPRRDETDITDRCHYTNDGNSWSSIFRIRTKRYMRSHSSTYSTERFDFFSYGGDSTIVWNIFLNLIHSFSHWLISAKLWTLLLADKPITLVQLLLFIKCVWLVNGSLRT